MVGFEFWFGIGFGRDLNSLFLKYVVDIKYYFYKKHDPFYLLELCRSTEV